MPHFLTPLVESVEALSAAIDARDLMMPAFRAIVRAAHDGDDVVGVYVQECSRRVLKHTWTWDKGEIASLRSSHNNGDPVLPHYNGDHADADSGTQITT